MRAVCPTSTCNSRPSEAAQKRAVPSAPAVATTPPLTATSVTGVPFGCIQRSEPSAFHIFTVASSPPVTTPPRS